MATIFGLADQIHSQVHYAIGGPMRALADAALVIVQATLDSTVSAEAFATGQRSTLDAAFTTDFMQSGFPQAELVEACGNPGNEGNGVWS